MDWEDKAKGIAVKTRANWLMGFKSLFLLSEKGYALLVVEPLLGNREWGRFAADLATHGFFMNAAFNTPEGCFLPSTSLRPTLVLLSRNRRDKLFIADPSDVSSVPAIIERFSTNTAKFTLEEGVDAEADSFVSFATAKCSMEVARLSRQYTTYRSYKLGDISHTVNWGRSGQHLQEIENSIYVPLLGKSPVVCTLTDLQLKHHNYVQLVLNSSLVHHKYAAMFFSSELGKLIRMSVYSGFIPKLVKAALLSLELPLPDVEEQRLIVRTYEQLVALQSKLGEFRAELSLNPKSAKDIRESTERMLEQLSALSDADRVRALVRKGESKTCEFKQTLSFDIRTQTREKHIEVAVLKTLVAFMNTEGGTLLVGVVDDGSICGVHSEINKFHKGSRDAFLLHFKNLVKDRIGEGFYPFIDYAVVDVDESLVLRVTCRKAKAPCFLDEKDFYVRTNPATDKLEGAKVIEYIDRHFQKRPTAAPEPEGVRQ
jgi:hypothetical protein